MNDEDLFIFFTQILEKLDSIDVQLKRLNYKQERCSNSEPEYYPPKVYCEPIYCPPEVYCEPYNPCIDYYDFSDCIYNLYYDYTLDYLVPIDEYCYDECYYANYCRPDEV